MITTQNDQKGQLSQERTQALFQNNEVRAILDCRDHRALAQYLAINVLKFTKTELKFIDPFWDPVFNQSWIYATEAMVTDEFGYAKGKNTLSHFHKKLSKDFVLDEDYKEVKDSHELVQKSNSRIFGSCSDEKKNKKGGSGSLKKYYIISGATYKRLLQSSQTEKGKECRQYFLKIESMASLVTKLIYQYLEYCQRIHQQQLVEEKQKLLKIEEENTKFKEEKIAQDDRVADLELKQMRFDRIVKNTLPLTKNQIFYLATSISYARQNRIKFGGVEALPKLKPRLTSYNGRSAQGDMFQYCKICYCHDYRVIEKFIKTICLQFMDKKEKEMIIMNLNDLINIVDFLVDNSDRATDYINEHIAALRLRSYDETSTPEFIDLNQLLNAAAANVQEDVEAKDDDIPNIEADDQDDKEEPVIVASSIGALRTEIEQLRKSEAAARFILERIEVQCTENGRTLADLLAAREDDVDEPLITVPIAIIEQTTAKQRKELGGLRVMRRWWSYLADLLIGANFTTDNVPADEN